MIKSIIQWDAGNGKFDTWKLSWALKNWITLSDEYECSYSVVDMHSITVRQDPATLRKRARALLTLYIAAGLDPEKKLYLLSVSCLRTCGAGMDFELLYIYG